MTTQQINLELPAEMRELVHIGSAITKLLTAAADVPNVEDTIYELQLAVHEICANIIDHSYNNVDDGKIQLELVVNEGNFSADICEFGEAFDPGSVPMPNLDEGQIRGYGIYLVNELMDVVEYSSTACGNCWHLAKKLS